VIGDSQPLAQHLLSNLAALHDLTRESLGSRRSPAQRAGARQSLVDLGQGVLILTLIESVRRPLEEQVIRLVESELESRAQEQIEQLCQRFLKLDQKIAEIRLIFGIEEDDLILNASTLEDLT